MHIVHIVHIVQMCIPAPSFKCVCAFHILCQWGRKGGRCNICILYWKENEMCICTSSSAFVHSTLQIVPVGGRGWGVAIYAFCIGKKMRCASVLIQVHLCILHCKLCLWACGGERREVAMYAFELERKWDVHLNSLKCICAFPSSAPSVLPYSHNGKSRYFGKITLCIGDKKGS